METSYQKSIGWDIKSEGTFQVSLYDLENDISEQNNIAELHPEIVKKLTSMAQESDSGLN